ncbi:MAG: hypothetical protein ABL864_14090 [Terricaulis sp.]
MTAPLITTDDLGDTSDDAVLACVLASGIIRSHCGWHIAPSAVETFTLDGPGTRTLAIPTLHLTAVASVEIDSVTELDFTWSARGLIRRALAAAWPSTFRSIEVTCTHGHATTPDAVRAVAISICRRQLANPEQLRQEAVAGYSVTYGGDAAAALTSAERNILAVWRIPGSP